jgi:hypothetical protein
MAWTACDSRIAEADASKPSEYCRSSDNFASIKSAVLAVVFANGSRCMSNCRGTHSLHSALNDVSHAGSVVICPERHAAVQNVQPTAPVARSCARYRAENATFSIA